MWKYLWFTRFFKHKPSLTLSSWRFQGCCYLSANILVQSCRVGAPADTGGGVSCGAGISPSLACEQENLRAVPPHCWRPYSSPSPSWVQRTIAITFYRRGNCSPQKVRDFFMTALMVSAINWVWNQGLSSIPPPPPPLVGLSQSDVRPHSWKEEGKRFPWHLLSGPPSLPVFLP